ncbi:hypothetical protein EVAR_94506_1 [Eumeta japonica]|uniref:Uncharacterized protein n=1 Tax=Eumeta variegata TaxID=151549 RepID=A0A4C1UUT1_EUMVA|nr:hypothetical protein EVAR_94506_1 [Eumeta japonica]
MDTHLTMLTHTHMRTHTHSHVHTHRYFKATLGADGVRTAVAGPLSLLLKRNTPIPSLLSRTLKVQQRATS